MTQQPSAGLGKRLAQFRRRNDMSAQELADATGGLVTRSVIANIENGRKSDVTVDQLFYLAYALGVNPLHLALPIDAPETKLQLAGDEARETWIVLAEYTRDHRFASDRKRTEAGIRAASVTRTVLDYEYLLNAVGPDPANDEDKEALQNLYAELSDSGVEVDW